MVWTRRLRFISLLLDLLIIGNSRPKYKKNNPHRFPNSLWLVATFIFSVLKPIELHRDLFLDTWTGIKFSLCINYLSNLLQGENCAKYLGLYDKNTSQIILDIFALNLLSTYTAQTITILFSRYFEKKTLMVWHILI